MDMMWIRRKNLLSFSELAKNALYVLPQETSFNGSSSYINTGIKLCQSDIDYTIAFVAKNGSRSLARNTPIFHCVDESRSPFPGLTMQVGYGNASVYVLAGLYNSSGQGETYCPTAPNAVNNVIVRHSSGSTVWTLDSSVNGDRQTQCTYTRSKSFAQSNNDLHIGCYVDRYGDCGRFWTGTIYDFRIYPYTFNDNTVSLYLSNGKI